MNDHQHSPAQLHRVGPPPAQTLTIASVPASTWTTDPEQRRALSRRAQLLAGASVTYNLIEAVIAISAGLVAGSVALVGFGLDSVVEVSSGLIILWQFRHRLPETRERLALRLLAFSFFTLAAYVTVESVRTLVTGADPDTSPVGIGLAIASLIVMRSCRGRSAAPARRWDRTRSLPTAPKPCSAPTCPRCCSPAWCSTPRSAGAGPTRSPAWSSPASPSVKG
jgi:hypothetical protein